MNSIRYDRAPSEELRKLLKQGGFLAPVVGLNHREAASTKLDVHFRSRDVIHVYCGLIRILEIERQSGSVAVTAHRSYTKQPCARGLFGKWRAEDPGFCEALDTYLRDVKVNPRHTKAEGAVQLRWSQVTEPWAPFDREAVLEYESASHREKATAFQEVEKARAELMNIYNAHRAEGQRRRWTEPSKSGRKIDQLAVDNEGGLVLIELKDASKRNAEVYYAPFQLLHYIWEWHSALEAVRPDLQALICARASVGMMPCAPQLNGRIRAVVGFGCDTRSNEVKRRYGEVLKVVNRHLPRGVATVETWGHAGSGPRRIE